MRNIKRKLTLAAVIVIISGCAGSPNKNVNWVKSYDNSSHGELWAKDKYVKESIAECSKKAYNKGVNIDGKLISNGEELESIYNKHTGSFARKEIRKINRAPSGNEAKEIAEKYTSNVPEYIRVIHRNMHIYEKCFYEDKGFSKYKRKVPFDKKTGQRLWYNTETRSFEVDNSKY